LTWKHGKKKLEDLVRVEKIEKQNIINFDEKGVRFDIDKRRFAVVEKKNQKERTRPKVRGDRQKGHITVISTVGANGKDYPLYIIFQLPSTNRSEVEFEDFEGEVIFNQSGWVNQNVKLEFCKWLLPKLPEGKKLFLFDNHSSNLEATLTDFFIANNIVALTFPAHLTHLLQPLDLTVFSSFSSYISESTGVLRRSQEFVFEKIPSLLARSWRKSADDWNVKSGWKKAGLNEVIDKAITQSGEEQQETTTTTTTTSTSMNLRDYSREGMVVTSAPVVNVLRRIALQRPQRNDSTTNVYIAVQNNTHFNLQQNNTANFVNVSPAPPTPKRARRRRRIELETVLPPGQLEFHNWTPENL
jgi:hypothetical protein